MKSRTRASRTAKLLATGTAAMLLFAACGGGGSDSDSDSTEGGAESTETTNGDSDVAGDDTGATDADGSSAGGSGINDTLAPDSGDEEPQPGGTLTIALEADVDGLNPTSSQLTASSGLMIASAVFDTLTAMNTDGDPVPYLAESVTPNDDSTSWEVKVREGVTFHDGTPLNADAVIANFEAQFSDPLVGLAVRPFYPEEGAIEKVDDYTVRFNLLLPNTRFASALSTQLGMVASPTWLEAAKDDPTLNQAPVGTGPFVFDQREVDSVTSFVRNDAWWNGSAYLDGVSFRIATDPATRADLLASGDVDAFHASDPATTIRAQEMGDEVSLMLDDTGAERFVMINAAAPPFDDIRARQALTYATPKQNVLALIGGGLWRSAESRFDDSSIYYNPDIVQAADEPDKAAPLVAEYCGEFPDNCTDGKINMEYQDSGPSVVQDNLKDILIDGWSPYFNVTHDRLFQDDAILQTVTGQYNVNTWRQFDAVDPVNDNVWLICGSISGLSLNFPRYCDEDRDALLFEAQSVESDEERIGAYKQVDQLINESFTYVFLAHELWMFAMQPSVAGVCNRTAPDGDALRCFSQGRVWFDTIWFRS